MFIEKHNRVDDFENRIMRSVLMSELVKYMCEILDGECLVSVGFI